MMKFTCEKNTLQNGISIAARAVSPRSTLPVLEGLLFSAAETGLSITGYDLKKGVYTNVDASVQEAGAAVISARQIYDLVRAMPDGMIQITVADGIAKVSCGRSRYELPVMSAADFPELPVFEEENSFKMEQGLLKDMINESIFAVSDSESKAVYMGTLFKLEDGLLTMAAVDGYRMAVRREPVNGLDVKEFIVPGNALADVERICDDGDDNISVSIGPKHILFEIGDTSLITRRLEGEFLNPETAIPASYKYEVTVDRAELLRVVSRVALVVDDKTRIPIRLTFRDGVIDVHCTSVRGRGDDPCVCEGSGGDMEIGFNHRYLSDALKAAPADNIKVCLNTSSSPCVIRPVDDEDRSFLYLVLPVRMRSEG